jgi:hypothetical protein
MVNTPINQSNIDWDSLLNILEKFINSKETIKSRIMSGFVTPNPTFYREWRTIILGGARMSGKTTTLVNRALPLKREALFITVNKSHHHIPRLLVELGTRGQPLPVVMTMKDFLSMYSGDNESLHKFKKIIVDDAAYVSERFHQNAFYDCVHNAATIDSLIYLIG